MRDKGGHKGGAKEERDKTIMMMMTMMIKISEM